MSIYVCISKKPIPGDSDGQEISENAWRNLALSQPDFRIPNNTDLPQKSYPGAPTERDLIWSGHNNHTLWWFSWFEGEIEVKSPDSLVIAKMVALAASLGARVVSETGETFDASGNHAGFEDWSEFFDGAL